jgi:hypothetical protein
MSIEYQIRDYSFIRRSSVHALRAMLAKRSSTKQPTQSHPTWFFHPYNDLESALWVYLYFVLTKIPNPPKPPDLLFMDALQGVETLKNKFFEVLHVNTAIQRVSLLSTGQGGLELAVKIAQNGCYDAVLHFLPALEAIDTLHDAYIALEQDPPSCQDNPDHWPKKRHQLSTYETIRDMFPVHEIDVDIQVESVSNILQRFEGYMESESSEQADE